MMVITKLAVAIKPSPKVSVGFSVRTCTRTLWICRKRLWNVACDSSRSDSGVLPRRKHESFTVWGSSRRLCRNSLVAVSATVCLLHAVARALRNLVVGVDDQVAVGRAADLDPG